MGVEGGAEEGVWNEGQEVEEEVKGRGGGRRSVSAEVVWCGYHNGT